MERKLDTSKFYLVGNNLSVDFVNTRIRENGAPKELLEPFEDLIAWAARANLSDLSQANVKKISRLIYREVITGKV